MSFYPSGPFVGKPTQDEQTEKAREDFLLDFSERTARAYKADLEDFFEWCSQDGIKPLKASARELDVYADSLLQRGYARATATRRDATVRRFLEHVRAKTETQ